MIATYPTLAEEHASKACQGGFDTHSSYQPHKHIVLRNGREWHYAPNEAEYFEEVVDAILCLPQ